MARHHLFSRTHSAIMLVSAAVVALAVTGCAAGRSELDMWVPPVAAAGSKQAVTIVEIRDLRPFAVNPGDPELPSLASQADVENPDKIARTIGRKRNSYGARMGEVTLPEGQTVTGIVRQTVINALQEKGYVVVADASPGVLPVSIDIEQFWAWFTPGTFEATLQFASRVRLYGPQVFELDATKIEVGSNLRTGSATDSAWGRVVRAGVEKLSARIRDEVEPATPRSNVATSGPATYDPNAVVTAPVAPMAPTYGSPTYGSPAPAPNYSTPAPAYSPPAPPPPPPAYPPAYQAAVPAPPAPQPAYSTPAQASPPLGTVSSTPEFPPAAPPSIPSPTLQPCDAPNYELSQACDASATEMR